MFVKISSYNSNTIENDFRRSVRSSSHIYSKKLTLNLTKSAGCKQRYITLIKTLMVVILVVQQQNGICNDISILGISQLNIFCQ